MLLVLDQLKDQHNFTQTEKRIADYILQHPSKISTIYIEDLAKLTYTSHSAIIRLCKKIGFTGFREFKIALSTLVHSQLYAAEQVNANFPFDEADSPMTIAKKMADLTTETVKKSFAQLNDELLSQIVTTLAQAQRVFLFARGDSQIRARSFQNKLIKINKFYILAEEYSDGYWNAASLTKKDCALFISYSGIVPQYDRIMEHFHQEKIPTILLTGNNQSTLLPFAEKALITIQEEYDFAKIGTFSSQVAFEYILDTLFSILYAQEYRQNLLSLKEKQHLLQNGLLSD